jgi:hypothetical protein
MSRIEAAFEKKLQSDLSAHVRVIVRTAQPPAQYVSTLEAKGFKVVRMSSLINAVTVEGSAQSALTLSNEAWIVRIEEDKIVHTM